MLLRGAAVGAAGYAVGKRAQQGQEQDIEVADVQEQAPPPQAPAAADDSLVDQLEQLAELKERGILTEEEFARQKARLLEA
jgi:membrane protease subunit (stomatin/prohibitin family)